MFNGLCFLASTAKSKDGYYMMAINDVKMDGNHNDDDSDFEVHHSAYELAVEPDTLNDTLLI
jgi:hypothetical protein